MGGEYMRRGGDRSKRTYSPVGEPVREAVQCLIRSCMEIGGIDTPPPLGSRGGKLVHFRDSDEARRVVIKGLGDGL